MGGGTDPAPPWAPAGERRAVAAEPRAGPPGAAPAVRPRGERVPRRRRAWTYVKALYWKGYADNVTGLSGMVAYNLLLSLFPLALVALFVTGNVLQSHSLETRVVADLQRLFPSATETTINRFLRHIRDDAAGFGVIALVTSVWFGSS